MHEMSHPLAGRTVTVRPAAPLTAQRGAEVVEILVEDWGDRVFGRSWRSFQGNPPSLIYATRVAVGGLPIDDEVVYGKCPNGLGHLIHVSEIQAG